MSDAGLVTSAESSGNTHDSPTGGAENGALDPDLQAVFEAWGLLTPNAKAAILWLAEKVSQGRGSS